MNSKVKVEINFSLEEKAIHSPRGINHIGELPK